MSQYCHSQLSPGANNIRLLRLMPYVNESTGGDELQCEIFEYSLQDLGKRTHLYDALSYTWGGPDKPRSISINKQKLAITENLYAALLRLRDRSLERVVWIDAICINQTDPEERGQQVQLMAMIYSKAKCVLIWLGEEPDDVEGILEDIQCAANEESIGRSNKINEKAIFKLLQRPWFQRIWVLQEVAAARHVVMICGSTNIDGYAFCWGLKTLRESQRLSYAAFPELQSLPSLTSLIERAGLRPKYTTNSLERYSLEIRPLAELIDMFHTRQASDPRDKVYALLGMSSDDLSKADLHPDYNVSWEKLFRQLIKFILGKDVSVETSHQRAVIKSKGYILGQVSSVEREGRQIVYIESRNAAWDVRQVKWTFQASAKPIQKRDIICLIHGASKPTIIRLFKEHFAVVIIAATPLNSDVSFGCPDTSQSIRHFLRDLLLVWDWEKPLEKSRGPKEYEILTKTYNQGLEYSKTDFGDYLDKTTRFWNDITILDDLGEYYDADKRLLEARSSFMMAFGKTHLPRLNSECGRTLPSFVAGQGDEDIVKVLLKTVDPDLKDGKYCRTPLSCAAQNGHEAVVRLLLETGKVAADSKDRHSQTPLLWAAKNGHKTVVKLLLETGKVDANLGNKYGQTPLFWATKNGHDAVIKLLLQTGKIAADTKELYGQALLSRVAQKGHEAFVKQLLDIGKVDADLGNEYGQTPLFLAAKNGHEAVIRLLLETGKVNAGSKDIYGQAPLSWAAQNGHEAVVKLLLKTGKVDANLENGYGQTPLSRAAQNGREAVVRLLLESGKVDADSKDIYGQAPLSWAVQNGHEAVVKLLLKAGKIVADSKDIHDQTPLLWAAKNGHEAIVKLLLETGKVTPNSKDRHGQTPLSWATKNGHEAIVNLLDTII